MNINAYLVIYIVTDLEKTNSKPGMATIHAVAEPEGVQGLRSNPLFHFHGIFKKNEIK